MWGAKEEGASTFFVSASNSFVILPHPILRAFLIASDLLSHSQ
jgi:hypothetical protein